jgi:hypothetical protein
MSFRWWSIKTLFSDVADVRQDIEWLLNHQLIQLRCIEPGDFEAAPEPLTQYRNLTLAHHDRNQTKRVNARRQPRGVRFRGFLPQKLV